MHFIIYLDFISHNMLADLSKIGKDLIYKKMIVGRIKADLGSTKPNWPIFSPRRKRGRTGMAQPWPPNLTKIDGGGTSSPRDGLQARRNPSGHRKRPGAHLGAPQDDGERSRRMWRLRDAHARV
jgi:hypothetical protein